MLYYLVAALLLAHAVFWGAGLALLSLPRGWRRAWWAWAAPCGWGLQSAVVWAGSHLPWAGTSAYGPATETIPLVLLLMAWRVSDWRCSLRAVAAAASVLMVGTLLLLMPLAKRGAWTLTTASLGSCDHADYAAGARVLQEFSRSDRIGFLDLPEVTSVGGVDRFFDYWLELNHFSPSAIIAHNGAVFGLQPYQLVSVTAAVFWLGLAPLSWLVARQLGWLPRRRWFAAAALVVSPLGQYAVHHAAMGQMLASQGIAMLTVIVTALVQRGRGWSIRRATLLALPPFWLIVGSYNFVLAIALAPALAGAFTVVAVRRELRLAWRVVLPLALALLICIVFFAGRFVGIAERFRLMEQYSFGWQVPLLLPEAWAGIVRDGDLSAWLGEWSRIPLAIAVLAASGLGIWCSWRRTPERAGMALVWLAVVAAGWGVLAWESRIRANASYDAFKVITVFLPLLVPVLLLWFGCVPGKWFAISVGLAGAWVLAIAVPSVRIHQKMASTTLRVNLQLLAVQRLEEMPRVESINLLIEDFWSRLWANAFLLRKQQYFPTHTYEGRRNTELRGSWNLRDSMIQSLPRYRRDGVSLNAKFHAVQNSARGLVRMEFGEGWHNFEHGGGERWRWSSGSHGDFRLENVDGFETDVRLVLRLRLAAPGRVALRLGGNLLARRPVGTEWVDWQIPVLRVPPGSSLLTLELESPSTFTNSSEPRVLGIAISRGVISAAN